MKHPSMNYVDTEWGAGVAVEPPETAGLSDTAARELLQFHLGRAIAHCETEGALRQRAERSANEAVAARQETAAELAELKASLVRQLKRLGPLYWGGEQLSLELQRRVDQLLEFQPKAAP